MIDLEDRILMAVPKKGRLKDITVQYLKKIGLSFHQRERFDIALCSATPLALVFLPAKDIPLYVFSGKVSYGITGQDMVKEHQVDAQVDEVMALGFGKCRLCIAAPKSRGYVPRDLIGKRIATSFPRLTSQYFQEKLGSSDITIREVSGSVEIAPTLDTAEAVVDLVETGSTLREAGLEIIDVIMETQAVLISRQNLEPKEKEWLERLKVRMQGVLTAEKYVIVDYNISKTRLKEAETITPGMKSPTVMPLEQEEWVAIRSVVLRNEMYAVIEALKKIGAEAILVSSMEYFQI